MKNSKVYESGLDFIEINFIPYWNSISKICWMIKLICTEEIVVCMWIGFGTSIILSQKKTIDYFEGLMVTVTLNSTESEKLICSGSSMLDYNSLKNLWVLCFQEEWIGWYWRSTQLNKLKIFIILGILEVKKGFWPMIQSTHRVMKSTIVYKGVKE